MENRILSQNNKLDVDYVDMRGILAAIYDQRRLISLFTCIFMLISLLYAAHKPVRYQASTLLRIQHSQHNFSDASHNSNKAQEPGNLLEDPLVLQLSLIKTEYILLKVLKKLDQNEQASAPTMLPISQRINLLRNNLMITDLSSQNEMNSSKMAIIRMGFQDNDKDNVIKVLESVVNVMQEKNIEFKNRAIANKLSYLKKQIALTKASLQSAQQKLNHYLAKSERLNEQFQTQTLLNRLTEIDKALEQKRLNKIELLQKFTKHHPMLLALSQQQQELENTRLQLNQQLQQLPDIDQVITDLKQRVEIKNKLYTHLLSQLHAFEAMQPGIVSDITVLSPVSTPEMIQPPRLLMIALFSLVIGFILSVMGVVIYKLLQRRIDDPAWIEQNWNLQNLITIPDSRKQPFNNQLASSVFPVLKQHDPLNPTLAALYSLRTLLQLKATENESNVISMLSIDVGTGKTFITANLATLLAKMGHKVLLIDADLHTGHLHHFFALKKAPGLADVITSHSSLEKTISINKDLPNLSILPSGNKMLEKTADLLMSNCLQDILEEAKKSYQFIILNTPPSSISSDCMLAGLLANINLLVIGTNCHKADEINTAIRNFQNAGVSLHGYIFNQIKTYGKKVKSA